MTFLNKLQNVEENNLDRNYSRISEILLYAVTVIHVTMQKTILNATIQCMFDTTVKPV